MPDTRARLESAADLFGGSDATMNDILEIAEGRSRRRRVVAGVAGALVVVVTVASVLVAIRAHGSMPASAPHLVWSQQLFDDDAPGPDIAGRDLLVQSVSTTEDGSSFIGALARSPLPEGTGEQDGVVIALDPSGSLVWYRTIASPSSDQVSATATDGTSVWAAGSTEGKITGSSEGRVDGFVRRYDLQGHPRWTVQFGTEGADLPLALAVHDGTAYVAGTTSGRFPDATGGGGQDVFLAAIDADGQVAWIRQFGSPGGDAAGDVTATSDAVYVVGSTRSAGEGSIAVRAFDLEGGPLWSARFGSPGADDAGRAIVATADALYITGSTFGQLGGASGGNSDAYLARMDPATGVLAWIRQFGGVGFEEATAIVPGPDAEGELWVIGSTTAGFGGAETQGAVDVFSVNVASDGVVGPVVMFGTSRKDSKADASGTTARAVAVATTNGALPGYRDDGDLDLLVLNLRTLTSPSA